MISEESFNELEARVGNLQIEVEKLKAKLVDAIDMFIKQQEGKDAK